MPGLTIDGAGALWDTTTTVQPMLPVPFSFPDRVKGPMAWSGAELKDTNRYVEQLSADDVQEIERALRFYKDLQLDPSSLSRELFPLSAQLASRLRAISSGLHHGYGFSVVTGLDPTRYSDEDNILIFAGIASHVADERSNLRHISDRSREDHQQRPQSLRPPELSIKMSFHTDINAGDILSLYSQNVAWAGGNQSVVSFWKVYNDLAVEDPDVLHTLAQNWRHEIAWSDHIEVVNRPLMHYHDKKLMFSFAKAFLVGSQWDQRLPDGEPITAAQRRAIAVLEDKFEQHRLDLPKRRGDILFLNNLSILHARDSFVDDAASGQTRHVVNVMLRDPERAWAQPAEIYDYSNARFVRPSARAVLTRDEFVNRYVPRPGSPHRPASPKAHD